MSNDTSLFTGDTSSADQAVENHQFDPSVDYVAQLVGEGKKFSDQNALAYGKLQADAHIARIEAERAREREELSKRASTEDLVDQIISRLGSTNTPNPSQVTNPSGTENKGPANSFDPSTIAKLVDERVNRNLELVQASQNLNNVRLELEKAWGPNYASNIQARIKSLGLNPKDVDTLASRNPRAAVALLNPQASMPQINTDTFTPPRSSGSPPSKGTTGNPVKNSNYYEKMRKENPLAYATREVQEERIAQFNALGDKFFS